MILIKITTSKEIGKRVDLTPINIKRRFMESIK